MRGKGLPNIAKYFSAVILDQVKYWWHVSPEKLWSTLEATQFPYTNLTIVKSVLLSFGKPILSTSRAAVHDWQTKKKILGT